MIIGITGSIATGKSAVTNYLNKKGYEVIDLDQISHRVLQKDALGYHKVIDYFGSDILLSDGEIDRKKLGKIIYSSILKRDKLNEITHPIIIKEMNRLLQSNTNPIKFVDVPLLFECKMEKMFDYIITVYVPNSIQIKRLMERDKISLEEANLKIQSQIDVYEKAKKSDFVIDNCSSIEYTYLQIDNIIKKLKGEDFNEI